MAKQGNSKGDLVILLQCARALLLVSDLPALQRTLGRCLGGLGVERALLAYEFGPGDSHWIQFDARGNVLQGGQRPALLGMAKAMLDGTGRQGNRELLAAPFVNAQVNGYLALQGAVLKQRALRRRASALLAGLADLVASRLSSLRLQARNERGLNAHCRALSALQARHDAELRYSALAHAEARELAASDELTGLQNRRGFLAKAEQCLALAHRQHLACAVIFADVDGLKTVNDECGHAVGDGLIQIAARIFASAFRQADVIARVGGDEFAAFTFDNAAPSTIVERILGKVAEHNRIDSVCVPLSLSIGVVSCSADSRQSLADYLQAADDAMYLQKRGRAAVPA